MLQRFLDPKLPSLKICGITLPADAERLAVMEIDALGANFWPKSKRFLNPAEADFLKALAGRILRVGVFVNAGPDHPRELIERGLIDVVQLHGDESREESQAYLDDKIPVIKALGIRNDDDLKAAADFPADALLLDAHAPGLYGGTGQTIDWLAAADFIKSHPTLSIILAGGIVPENAAEALATVHPAALDTASGSESAPGIKDFEKVAALKKATA
ncbi:N-(5'-phosphoribosyl)anthranilate isomerase [Haloferula chungangensis]|uniref:N-(5'-phosphoribosyl)anthranilate isomerase n=1 Tax=Haloferula chungangensis TaxID=1048331 RepID=A0ABW2L5P1_9BACT